MRRALRGLRPDVVVAFGDQTNVIALLAGVGGSWPVIVSERTDPRNVSLGRVWTLLRHLAYRRAGAVVLVAEEGRQWFGRTLAGRVRVLPNPVTTRSLPHDVGSPHVDDVIRLVTVGRLAPEKGLDLLFHALHMLPSDLAARWTLDVVGDGPARGMLMRLADDLRLTDRVRWAGLVPDPSPYVQSGDVFVLPSRFEGFPNALAEAMASGRAVLSTDCRSGPRELITDGVNGLLVAPNDPAAIASGLERVLRDRGLRARLAEAAPAATRELTVDAIGRRWEALFEEVMTQRGRG
jgi:glycosyltransferase involved in cell wall biosynthesis